MMEFENWSLSLFDGEAGASGASAPGQQTAGGAAGENLAADGEALDAAAQEPVDKKAQWKQIREEFKEEFDREFQSQWGRRHKDYKDMVEKVEAYQPLVDLMATKYKVADGSIDAIRQAAQRDDSYWEDRSAETGMSVEALREIDGLRRQNEQLQRTQAQRQEERNVHEQIARWDQEAAVVATQFPGFNLGAEADNPQFLGMLRAGVPMQMAYEVMHMDEIKSGLVAQTAQETEKKVVDNIRAKGARPAENGADAGSGVGFRKDASQMSLGELRAYAERARRGESITTL